MGDEPAVGFKPNTNDVEVGGQVEVHTGAGRPSDADIHSPSKNRLTGSPLSQHKNGERRNSFLPRLFERSSRSWWNPQFDSNILELEHIKRSFPQLRTRFRYALAYIIFSCVVWSVYFFFMGSVNWLPFLIGTLILLGVCIVILGFTFSPVYHNLMLHISVVFSLVLCIFCLLNFVYNDQDISSLGTYTGAIEILLMMYTVIPMSLYLCVTLGVIFSVIYEVLVYHITGFTALNFVIGRVLLHLCIHLIGIHVFIMAQVRKRSTFLKVCQSIMSRRDLEFEKQLKEMMIYSLMPPQVAKEVIRSREEKDKDDDNEDDDSSSGRRPSSHKHGSPEKGHITFRSFHMSKMDNVSILFADIVGFTKMSSNKTAETLVGLLNDLFGRFDILCTNNNCEKISTLGDCYYCVAGCPLPRADHAKCCVEMGLAMCNAIQEFDRDHNEEVNMRVGVHTGTVLCGLVGTRRFKFDVWSHDVTLANTMESDGKPGMVHVSNPTYVLITEDYVFEKGEPVEDIRKHKVLVEYYNTEKQEYDIKHIQDSGIIETWFVVGRKEKASIEAANTDVVETVITSDCTITVSPTAEDGSTSPSGDQNNHAENKGDTVPTAALLGQRETLATSIEDISADNRHCDTDQALKDQIGVHRSDRMAAQELDNQLVECMDGDKNVEDYLYRPPINRVTLNFLNKDYEKEYRSHYQNEQQNLALTFAMPHFNAFVDMVISLVFLTLISICCFVGFTMSLPWIIFFVFAYSLVIVMLLPLLVDVCTKTSIFRTMERVGRFFASWYPRHIFGCIAASLPTAAVYSNFSCQTFSNVSECDMFFCLLLVTSLLHYCNFTMLSSWLKSVFATVAGLILLLLIILGICYDDKNTSDVTMDGEDNVTSLDYQPITGNVSFDTNTTGGPMTGYDEIFGGGHVLKYEIILDMVLLLFLIWFLNREFEINYRLSYHGSMRAKMDRKKMQDEKEQADWLLHNIIPEHVTDVLKKTKDYSKTHRDVGVIFAKIVNYDDFYDESYEGGKEYLRVLNELMGDFEDLFDDEKYKDVEKIKTIGACLMAASGLNPQTRNQNKNPNAHLCALMDFSLDVLQKLEQFNAEIFHFDFEMAIGYNYGEVTAGVIGTTKLLYDIWGDTVNISSRMYSTGVSGRIQVTEDTAKKLAEWFEFEYRGQIYVKGKGDMNTFLLTKKKEGATWE